MSEQEIFDYRHSLQALADHSLSNRLAYVALGTITDPDKIKALASEAASRFSRVGLSLRKSSSDPNFYQRRKGGPFAGFDTP